MGAHTVELDPAGFDGAVARDGLILIDFWASWCGPCRAFAPIYESAAARNADVVFAKVDTEAHEALSERFDIESIPTLMAFCGGVPVHRQSGAMPAASLQALIDNLKKLDPAKAKSAAAAKERSAHGERPASVPAEATWDESDQEWAAGPFEENGQKHGLWKCWRADGTLCNECPHVHGKPHGPFKRFHENGELAQDGMFAEGQLHGTRRWLACDGFTTERMHEGDVCALVRRTEMDYERGQVVGVRHFDAQGRRILPTSGEPYPERPRSVAPEAEFVEPEQRWSHVRVDARGQREGLGRFWNKDGSFQMQAEFHGGEREGPYSAAAAKGEFTNARVTLERGRCERDLAVGTWTLETPSGVIVASRDLGTVQDEDALLASPVLSNQPRGAAEWRSVAAQCLKAHHPGEALLAFSRVAGMEAEAGPLLDAIGQWALPRSAAAGREVAAGVAEADSFVALAQALLRGGDAGDVLRSVAILLDKGDRSRAALDFINAAILLAPDRGPALFTRGLVLMSLGLDAHALNDAQALTGADAGRGQFLQRYTQILFPTFDFWPTREAPETTYDGLPDRPAQDLAAIQRIVQKYATRLERIRERMNVFLKPGASPHWRLPTLTALLPDGPVELDQAELEAENDSETLAIDETIDVEGPLTYLLRVARADWQALCWLCWSCGLSDLTMPKKVIPPKAFGKAAGMAAQRLWRCRDRRVTGGEGARSQGIEGFSWEGIEIDTLEAPLVPIAEAQYAEMQAMFYWLTKATNLSPWQNNLRGS